MWHAIYIHLETDAGTTEEMVFFLVDQIGWGSLQ
jgi:hypothetical protein